MLWGDWDNAILLNDSKCGGYSDSIHIINVKVKFQFEMFIWVQLLKIK